MGFDIDWTKYIDASKVTPNPGIHNQDGPGTSAQGQLPATSGQMQKVGEGIKGGVLHDVAVALGNVVQAGEQIFQNAFTTISNWGNIVDNGVKSAVRLVSSIVNSWFGWVGDWTDDDAADALANQAATIASMSAAVTDLQNRAQNVAVGGVTQFIDFTLRAAATSLGADFNQIYSGSGTGYLGLDNGAKWFGANDAPRDCDFLKNDFQTTTDYQKIGIAFGSTPAVDALGHKASNEIHGRKNAAGDTYVFGLVDKNTAQLGCVVAGARTVFVTSPSGKFSFKSNSTYWLECGTIAGLRVFRLLENNTPILIHTEVGTTSQVGAGYRSAGGHVHAYAQGFPAWSLSPARMLALAIADNQPGTVTGSGAHMYRTTTGNVSASSGSNAFPDNFFNNIGASSGDVPYDLETGKFTITEDAYYLIEASVGQPGGSTTVGPSQGSGWPSIYLEAWLDDSPARRLGAPSTARVSSVNTTGNTVTFAYPTGLTGSGVFWLEAGTDVQLGYNASASRSGAFTADSGGLQTNFTITRVGAKYA